MSQHESPVRQTLVRTCSVGWSYEPLLTNSSNDGCPQTLEMKRNAQEVGMAQQPPWVKPPGNLLASSHWSLVLELENHSLTKVVEYS